MTIRKETPFKRVWFNGALEKPQTKKTKESLYMQRQPPCVIGFTREMPMKKRDAEKEDGNSSLSNLFRRRTMI